jgi:hypothetical protein
MMTEDLAPLFFDFGLVAEHGTDSALVLLDMPTSSDLGGYALEGEYSITLPAESLPGLAMGETVTVSGTAYRVREVYLLDDGALKRVMLDA